MSRFADDKDRIDLDRSGDISISELPGTGARARRSPSHRLLSLFAVVVSLAILVGGGWFVYSKGVGLYRSLTNTDDYPGPGTDAVTVTIPAGSTGTAMADILYEADVVASTKAFMAAVRSDDAAFRKVQAGDYRLKKQMKASAALTALSDPANQVRRQFTVPEGLRNTDVLTRLAKDTPVPLAELTAVAATAKDLGLPAWTRNKTEGFLFPDTYQYDATPTATEVLKLMTSQFNKVAGELNFEAQAKALGRDPYDVLTVASTIEKEVNKREYSNDVAQVLYNRLDRKMNLQLDSTVIYANNKSGKLTTTSDERNIDSPYNTYRYAGLPPGAISNPGRAAMQAALTPTLGDLLYFVAVNPETGETKFAATGEGHQANVLEFQAWCQANRGKC